jgi:hypothetical protein
MYEDGTIPPGFVPTVGGGVPWATQAVMYDNVELTLLQLAQRHWNVLMIPSDRL